MDICNPEQALTENPKMVQTSKVSKAASNTPTLRTSIPAKFVKELEIEEGSVLEWKIEEIDGKKTLIITKLG